MSTRIAAFATLRDVSDAAIFRACRALCAEIAEARETLAVVLGPRAPWLPLRWFALFSSAESTRLEVTNALLKLPPPRAGEGGAGMLEKLPPPRASPLPHPPLADRLEPLVPPEIDDDDIDGVPIDAAEDDDDAERRAHALQDEAESADPSAARELHRRACALAPRDDLTWLVAARFAAAAGDRAWAREAFARCVALDPGEIFELDEEEFTFLRDDPELRELLEDHVAGLPF